MSEFTWDVGFSPQADPNEVGLELERIRVEQGGELHPSDVVDAARSPESPLHKLFNWDDSEAAELYRRSQARGVIRRLRFVADPRSQEKPVVKRLVYVSPGQSKHPGYVPAEQAMADPVARVQVLANALAVLRGWQRRYGQLEELADLAATIGEVIEEQEVKTKKTKV